MIPESVSELELDVCNLQVRCLRSTITFRFKTESGVVIRTRYRGQKESYLNNTAFYIFSTIEEHNHITIGQIIDILHQKYDDVDYDILKKDCISCLYELWRLVLIEWVSACPFVKYLDGSRKSIRQATHDDYRNIVKILKADALCVDLSTGFSCSRSHIIGLLTGEDYRILVHEACSAIDAVIIATVTKSDWCSVMTMGGSRDGLFALVEYIKRNGVDEIIVQILHGQGNTISLNEMGFRLCGQLRSEIKDGDVDVYFL